MNDVTTNTVMGSDREVFRNPSTAFGACLRCRGEGFVFDELSSSTLSLIGQHTQKHSPRRISDMFSETMITKHTPDVKGLNADETILINEYSTLLVHEISSLISNLDVTLSNLITGFPTIHRTLLFPAQSPLKFLQPMLGFDEKARIADRVSVAQGGEVLQPNINSDLVVGMGMFCFNGFKFTGEYSKPLTSPITFNGHGLEFTSRQPMEYERYVAYPGDMQPLIRENLKPGLRIRDALNPLPEPGKPNLNPLTLLLLLNPPKEMFIGFRESVSTILENLGVDLYKLRIMFLHFFNDFTQLSLTIKPYILSCIFQEADYTTHNTNQTENTTVQYVSWKGTSETYSFSTP